MAEKKTTKSKKKTLQQTSSGSIYIQATYNNTIVTATDTNGNTLGWTSAGHCGFKGPKKATPYASSVVIRQLGEKMAPVGLKDVHVFVTGVGAGRDSAVRSLNASGFNVLSIKDLTPIPHNGCRAPKSRRM